MRHACVLVAPLRPDRRALVIEQDDAVEREETGPVCTSSRPALSSARPSPTTILPCSAPGQSLSVWGVATCVAVDHAPAVDRAIEQVSPFDQIALLDAEDVRRQPFAGEVVVAAARCALLVGTAFPAHRSGLPRRPVGLVRVHESYLLCGEALIDQCKRCLIFGAVGPKASVPRRRASAQFP